MAKSLKTFHFDAKKSGSILKEWAKSAGMSYQRVADETSYSYDTINNSLSGKIVELSLERVFKIATCTGHSVCEYISLMLKDEDIDFADLIHVLRDSDFTLVPYTDTLVPDTKSIENPVQTSVQAPANYQSDPIYQAVYQAMMKQANDTHQANLDRFKRLHEDYVRLLEEDHKEAMDDLEEAYKAHMATVTKVARQRLRWIIILTVLLLAVIVWFIWDLSHPELGLIRLKQMGYFSQHIIGLLR